MKVNNNLDIDKFIYFSVRLRVIVDLYNLRLKLVLEWLYKWFRGYLYAFEIEAVVGAIRGYIRCIRCKASVLRNKLNKLDI